jgi:hypothetical protein
MNSYLNDRKAIDRLKKEYQEHGNLIIGFDFDCTIYDYHKEGLELQPVISLLKECSDLGFTMCLYSLTMKGGSPLSKQLHTTELGINVHYFNKSPVLPIEEQSTFSDPKPYFNILLDDRAGLSAAYNILKTTLIELKLI